jgi:hypothetical protein
VGGGVGGKKRQDVLKIVILAWTIDLVPGINEITTFASFADFSPLFLKFFFLILIFMLDGMVSQ